MRTVEIEDSQDRPVPDQGHDQLGPGGAVTGDVSRKGQHVGNDQNVALLEDIVSRRGGRAIGALDHDLGAELLCPIGKDLALKSGRNQEVGLEQPEIVA